MWNHKIDIRTYVRSVQPSMQLYQQIALALYWHGMRQEKKKEKYVNEIKKEGNERQYHSIAFFMSCSNSQLAIANSPFQWQQHFPDRLAAIELACLEPLAAIGTYSWSIRRYLRDHSNSGAKYPVQTRERARERERQRAARLNFSSLGFFYLQLGSSLSTYLQLLLIAIASYSCSNMLHFAHAATINKFDTTQQVDACAQCIQTVYIRVRVLTIARQVRVPRYRYIRYIYPSQTLHGLFVCKNLTDHASGLKRLKEKYLRIDSIKHFLEEVKLIVRNLFLKNSEFFRNIRKTLLILQLISVASRYQHYLLAS